MEGFKMNKRRLGKSGLFVTEIGLGTWQLGAKWGEPFDETIALDTLNAALKAGVNFYDTADVYNGGASEAALGLFKNKHLNAYIIIATKAGRYLNPHIAKSYHEANIRKFILDSLQRLKTDQIDLLQLHCPPSSVYANEETYIFMDRFVEEGLIKHYGVSVETVDEAMEALKHPHVASIQIIFNMFRLKPMEIFFEAAKKQDVGIIVRVPLASGLLSGKMNAETHFNQSDHRFYNRDGAAFDKGETFSGVNFNDGLKAVEALKKVFVGQNLAQIALRYILMFDAVSTVIPGASRPEHITSNVLAAELPPLTASQMQSVKDIYDTYIRQSVHHLW
jgi:aryl-alcohol dehydrogenase-like predicted oxidoreductase